MLPRIDHPEDAIPASRGVLHICNIPHLAPVQTVRTRDVPAVEAGEGFSTVSHQPEAPSGAEDRGADIALSGAQLAVVRLDLDEMRRAVEEDEHVRNAGHDSSGNSKAWRLPTVIGGIY